MAEEIVWLFCFLGFICLKSNCCSPVVASDLGLLNFETSLFLINSFSLGILFYSLTKGKNFVHEYLIEKTGFKESSFIRLAYMLKDSFELKILAYKAAKVVH